MRERENSARQRKQRENWRLRETREREKRTRKGRRRRTVILGLRKMTRGVLRLEGVISHNGSLALVSVASGDEKMREDFFLLLSRTACDILSLFAPALKCS